MRPFIIPIFITHQGCPHRCIFCNQHPITGYDRQGREITAAEVEEIIAEWLQRPRKFPKAQTQVAFYGGSFTGLAKSRQKELLNAARPFLQSGAVELLRLSTRPDFVDNKTPVFLRRHGVKIVELGVQSMDERVLAASGRGHTAAQVVTAADILHAAGLTVGIQLMIGLPGETTTGLLESARRIAALQPAFVRIYPTLVIQGSGLARLYAEGGYKPLSILKAIGLAGLVKKIFDRQGIRIIRMGLQPSAALEKEVLAGPYHPSFGELVLSRFFFKTARRLLAKVPTNQTRRLSIAAADHSAFLGPKSINIKRLADLGLLPKMDLTLVAEQRRHTIQTGERSDQHQSS